MLRITRVERRPPDVAALPGVNSTPVLVTMEGQIHNSVDCTLTITLRDRETDAALIAAAHRVARDAIGQLYKEMP